ncbi:MAG: AMP-binding protein, partial [Mycobacterium sp.]
MRAGEPVGDRIAVVVPTSGTTGIPKGAMLSAAALTAGAVATHA